MAAAPATPDRAVPEPTAAPPTSPAASGSAAPAPAAPPPGPAAAPPVLPPAATAGPARSPPAAPAAPAATVPPEPLTGTVSDHGAVRHDAVRSLEWSVDGASKVLGSAEAGFARLHGMVSVGGTLTAVDLRADGTLTVNGPGRLAGRLTLRGTGRFLADLRAHDLIAHGRLEVAEALAVTGDAVVGGITEVGGAIEAGTLCFTGALRATGSVTAGEIRGTLQGVSRTGPIRAATVTIDRGPGVPWRTAGRLTTLRIDATTAYLTGVTVEYLKADAVHLGPDCRVARMDGRLVERHRTARVGPSSVSEPPAGISR